MKMLTNERLSLNKYLTEEGYLICVDSILARTGVQIYLKSELLDDENITDDGEVEVIRTPEEVFDEKTIASFENKPITIEHPDDFVNTDNHSNLAVGFVRDVKRDIIDEQEVLIGNLIITDKNAIDLINRGKKFLSCGYDCDLVEKDGKIYQKNIRGNHIAICDNPRGGITQIVDANSTVDKPSVKLKQWLPFFRGTNHDNYKGYGVIQKVDGHLIVKDNRIIKTIKDKSDCYDWIDEVSDLKTSLNKIINYLSNLNIKKINDEKINNVIKMLEQLQEGV